MHGVQYVTYVWHAVGIEQQSIFVNMIFPHQAKKNVCTLHNKDHACGNLFPKFKKEEEKVVLNE